MIDSRGYLICNIFPIISINNSSNNKKYFILCMDQVLLTSDFTCSNTCGNAQLFLRILWYNLLRGREASFLTLKCFHLFFLLLLKEVSVKAQITIGQDTEWFCNDSSKTSESIPGIINAMVSSSSSSSSITHGSQQVNVWTLNK